MKFKIVSLFVLCAILISCGTSRQGGKKQRKGTKAQVVLTPEQQRKYDYFFLEASRLKMKDDYSAAFDLLQHCLTINPDASSALYEISQYYMYLKQVPQGQAALEKAVENDPDNFRCEEIFLYTDPLLLAYRTDTGCYANGRIGRS